MKIYSNDISEVMLLLSNPVDWDEKLLKILLERELPNVSIDLVKALTKLINDYDGDVTKDNNKLLIRTCCCNEEEIAKLLLETGADVHALDDCALRVACYFGHKKIVKILLDVGATVDVLNNTPIYIANKMHHNEIVNLLIENGAIPVGWNPKITSDFPLTIKEGKHTSIYDELLRR
jgi:ankyrin repeat protein